MYYNVIHSSSKVSYGCFIANSSLVQARIDKAIKEFKQLETVGEKAQFAIRKAAVPAAAAITAVAGALGLAAKAAAEDEQQQAILANTMQNVVGATDATVAATRT